MTVSAALALSGQRAGELARDDGERQPGPALARRLADADDGGEARAVRGQRLGLDVGDRARRGRRGARNGRRSRPSAPASLQHLGGDVAGMGAAGARRGSPGRRPASREPAPRAPAAATSVAGGQIMASTPGAKPASRQPVAHPPRLAEGGAQARSSSSCRPPAAGSGGGGGDAMARDPLSALDPRPFLSSTAGGCPIALGMSPCSVWTLAGTRTLGS